MGVLDEIPKQESYTELTLKHLEGVIKDAFFNQPIKEPEIVLYTGWLGMFMINLTMMGIGTPIVYWTHATYKKKFGIITLNLFEKAGFIKAIINKNKRTVEIRRGTVVIKEAFNFDELKEYLASLSPKYRKEFTTKKGVIKYYR